MILLNIFKIVFLLGFLVTIHEGGHFIVAKLSNIKVEQFSIGFGPKIYSKQGKETLYSISLIPFGGYVKMLGEEERSDDPRSFNNAKIWKRMAVVLAGPIVNIIFALLVYFILIFVSGVVVSTEISGIIPEAEQNIGQYLQVGDVITKVNGIEVNSRKDIMNVLYQNGDKEVRVNVNRDGNEYEYTVKPTEYGGTYILGIEMTLTREASTQEKLEFSINETIGFLESIGTSMKMLFTGKVGMDQMTGPVGISKMVVETNGIYNFVYLLTLVSLSLGVTNLLPIPALDGGRFLILLVEAIRRKPLPQELEFKIISLGFTFLIVLSLYVTYNDVFRIVSK